MTLLISNSSYCHTLHLIKQNYIQVYLVACLVKTKAQQKPHNLVCGSSTANCRNASEEGLLTANHYKQY